MGYIMNKGHYKGQMCLLLIIMMITRGRRDHYNDQTTYCQFLGFIDDL